MINHFSLIVLFLALISGTLVLVANHRRRANRALFFGIVHFSIWLILREISSSTPESLFWFRLCVSVGTLMLVSLVVITEVISKNRLIAADLPTISILLLCLAAASIPWTDAFVHNSSSLEYEVAGRAYFLFIIVICFCYISFCALSLRRIKALTGAARLELQTVALPAAAIAVAIFCLMGVRAVFPGTLPKHTSLLLSLCFVVWLSYSISTHRIFDAQYLFRVSCRALLLIVAMTVCGLALFYALHPALPLWLTFGVIAGAALFINGVLGPKLDRVFFNRPALAAARTLVHQIARTSLSEGSLKTDLASTVGGWTEARVGVLSPDLVNDDAPSAITLLTSDPVFTALEHVRWATPERLQRERSTEGRALLQRFLTTHELGALVLSGGDGTPVVLAVGLRASRRPFTYPEIQQLQEFASVAQLALVRVRLIEQAIHADRLATVGILGASLAHEIRNPLYAIKAFAELLTDHYNQAEFRFQFTKMVGDEIVRIDDLISQMMRMASPRKPSLTPLRFNSLVETSLDLIRHKIRSQGIVLETDLKAQHDLLETDSAFVRQVLLNLCINAGQVLSERPDPRWIRVATRDLPHGVELSVTDNGPGIPPSLRPRLFQRFQSMSARGLGLGLPISREIMASLGGTLEADPPVEGHGAVFRALFPRVVQTEQPIPSSPDPVPSVSESNPA